MTTPAHNLESLMQKCRPGWSLPREFYVDETLYHVALERVWRRGWVFAGHTCQIPQPGYYFTLEMDTDSILIVRSDDGTIHGLHNVCRHRGTRLCPESCARVNRIVSTYHQRGDAREGILLSC